MIDHAARLGFLLTQSVLVVCFFLIGCATDKVAWDLVNYVNQDILGIAELERRPLERYALARKDKHATEQTEVKILYDNEAIYFGAMLYDISPDSIFRYRHN